MVLVDTAELDLLIEEMEVLQKLLGEVAVKVMASNATVHLLAKTKVSTVAGSSCLVGSVWRQ